MGRNTGTGTPLLDRKFKPLTPLQSQVLELHDQGLTDRAIQQQLGWKPSARRSVQLVLEFALLKAGRAE